MCHIVSLCFIFNLFSSYYVQSAEILAVFPFPSISHQVVFQPIWKELSLRGHKVTVLTPNPLNDRTLTNLTEIDTAYTYDILKKHSIQKIAPKEKHFLEIFDNVYKLQELILDASFTHPEFAEILQNKEQHYDLILIENCITALVGLNGRFKTPIISVSSLGAMLTTQIAIGNPTNPILYPEYLFEFRHKSTIWQRMKIVFDAILFRLYYYLKILPSQDRFIRKYLGDDIPYLGELEKNISMMFLNVNPILYPIRPNLPAVIEIDGLIHVKPNKSLPSDLQEILDEAREGVIYISLGSNVKSVDISDKLKKTIMQTVSELPYKFLWKWESDYMPGKPQNVVIRKWLPQQDLLAHPNIKAFITQGGLQSTQEAISRAVPLIGMPFFGDQPLNVFKLVELGIAVGVDPAIVTTNELKNSIIEVAENVKYRNKMKEIRDLINDVPMTGLEKIIFWSEYVIRHKGAKHLQSPSIDVPWYQYLFLDIILVLISIIVILILVIYKSIAYYLKRYPKINKKLKNN